MNTHGSISPMTRAASRGALVAALLLAAPLFGAVQAQGAVDPRFQPWVGCWKMVTPDDAQSASGDMRPTRACVVPSSSVAGSVDLMLFARDSLVSRTAVPKPGVSTARAIDECTGTPEPKRPSSSPVTRAWCCAPTSPAHGASSAPRRG